MFCLLAKLPFLKVEKLKWNCKFEESGDG